MIFTIINQLKKESKEVIFKLAIDRFNNIIKIIENKSLYDNENIKKELIDIMYLLITAVENNKVAIEYYEKLIQEIVSQNSISYIPKCSNIYNMKIDRLKSILIEENEIIEFFNLIAIISLFHNKESIELNKIILEIENNFCEKLNVEDDEYDEDEDEEYDEDYYSYATPLELCNGEYKDRYTDYYYYNSYRDTDDIDGMDYVNLLIPGTKKYTFVAIGELYVDEYYSKGKCKNIQVELIGKYKDNIKEVYVSSASNYVEIDNYVEIKIDNEYRIGIVKSLNGKDSSGVVTKIFAKVPLEAGEQEFYEYNNEDIYDDYIHLRVDKNADNSKIFDIKLGDIFKFYINGIEKYVDVKCVYQEYDNVPALNSNNEYTYVKVSFFNFKNMDTTYNSDSYSYISNYEGIQVGDYVQLKVRDKNKLGKIISVGSYNENNVPYPITLTKLINKVFTKI